MLDLMTLSLALGGAALAFGANVRYARTINFVRLRNRFEASVALRTAQAFVTHEARLNTVYLNSVSENQKGMSQVVGLLTCYEFNATADTLTAEVRATPLARLLGHAPKKHRFNILQQDFDDVAGYVEACEKAELVVANAKTCLAARLDKL